MADDPLLYEQRNHRAAAEARNRRPRVPDLRPRDLLPREHQGLSKHGLSKGNLIKGFDNYLNAKVSRNLMLKKIKIEQTERLFSLSSAKSKTSEAVEEMLLGNDIKQESNQINHKRNRSRMIPNHKGKILGREEGEEDEDEMSIDNILSMEESSNNVRGRGRKHKKIGKGGKGPRRM